MTKKQEFDELKKKGCFALQTCNWGGFLLVLDETYENALWRLQTDKEHTARRWQHIKVTRPRNSEAWREYITIYGTRYYLDEFTRA